MAKEAKIGLLLGLLFIIGIAVVLRGVHENTGDVWDEQLSINGDKILDAKQEDKSADPGLRQAVEQLAPREQITHNIENNQTAHPTPTSSANPPSYSQDMVAINQPGYNSPPGNLQGPGQYGQPGQNQGNYSNTPSYMTGRSYSQVGPSSVNQPGPVGLGQSPQGSNEPSQPGMVIDVPVSGNEAQSGSVLRYEHDLPSTEAPVEPTVARSGGPIRPDTGELEKSLDNLSEQYAPQDKTILVVGRHEEKPKQTYVVAKADNLSKIAVKFYGSDQGNRLENIKKIFQANRDKMKSIDKLKIGQKLIIPGLASVRNQAGVTSNQSQDRKKLRNTTSYNKTYEVKKGDSLWAIAKKELGKGGRFKEIAKLNSDIIGEDDSLKPGMKLKLPGN